MKEAGLYDRPLVSLTHRLLRFALQISVQSGQQKF